MEPSDEISVFGVSYRHLVLPCGDELYITEFGVPFIDQLHPDSYWSDEQWFRANSQKLFGHGWRSGGTGTVYRVRTKEFSGRSLTIVLKWNRMGQDVPGTQDVEDLLTAEFNSPYEEFALVMELRDSAYESPGRILTHKPLAIYVPKRRADLDQLGRRKYKMQAKVRNHPVELDMFRPYAVIYQWVKGIDAGEACRRELLSEEETQGLTRRAEEAMRVKGFVVKDQKSHHVIIRADREGAVLRRRDGTVPYAMVDFELLERTPEREEKARQAKRREYLQRQANRFEAEVASPLPPHRQAVSLLGVDYIHGPAESTDGELWVVGKDPSLFDFFLPERWRVTPRERLSVIDPIFCTFTKDDVHLVWRISRVGQKPDMDPFKEDERKIIEHGYNSPFEEIAMALDLARMGVPTTYPRAIYMTGQESRLADMLRDESRYRSHAHLRTPGDAPLLRPDRDYLVVWGYWNKPDALLAQADRDHYRPIDALNARRERILSDDAYVAVMGRVRERLAEIGIEDLNLRGNHVLLALDRNGELIRAENGQPEARICNFELLRKANRT